MMVTILSLGVVLTRVVNVVVMSAPRRLLPGPKASICYVVVASHLNIDITCFLLQSRGDFVKCARSNGRGVTLLADQS